MRFSPPPDGPLRLCRFASTYLFALLLCPGCVSKQLPLLPPGVPRVLYEVDFEPLTPPERVFVQSLQGLVSRREPAIWIRSEGMSRVLMERLIAKGATRVPVESIYDLVGAFRSEVAGVVVYEYGTESLNVATSLAGPKRALAVDASVLPKAMLLGLDVVEDVRGVDERTAFERWGDLLAPGVAVEQPVGKAEHLRDFAVARRAFTFYDAGDGSLRRRVLERVGPQALVYGWGENEHEWIDALSRSSAAGVPADWCRNLSVMGGVEAGPLLAPPPDPEPVREGERVIAFVLTDGDNVQFMTGGFVDSPLFWASPRRGRITMTWEVPPVLGKIAPAALGHFYDNATRPGAADVPRERDETFDAASLFGGVGPRDGFVTGPSGAAYCFPSSRPDREASARQTAHLMQLAGLRVATVIDSLDGRIENTRELLAQNAIEGVLYNDYAPYNRGGGRVFWQDGKPAVSFRFLLWEPNHTPETLARAVAEMPARPTEDPASYGLVAVHAWSFHDSGGPIEAVWRTLSLLPPGTRVVTAEEMVVLLRRHFGRPMD